MPAKLTKLSKKCKEIDMVDQEWDMQSDPTYFFTIGTFIFHEVFQILLTLSILESLFFTSPFKGNLILAKKA